MAINTFRNRDSSSEILDPDGSLTKALSVKPISTPSADDIRRLAEAEFMKLHEHNRKESEKKAYHNQVYGEEIYLLFLLEDCRLYLSLLKILENKFEKMLEEHQAQLSKTRLEDYIQNLQNQFQAIFKAQMKQEPLNQDKEKLYTKTVAQLAEVETKIDVLKKKMQDNWGATTWEEGLKLRAKETVNDMRKSDPLAGLDLTHLTPEKREAAKSKVEEMFDIIEERLGNRPSIASIRKVLEASHKKFAEKFMPPAPLIPEASAAPSAPLLDKNIIFAPSNKSIKTQAEIDTEVLIAANARNVYVELGELKESATRLGVNFAKSHIGTLIEKYTSRINEQTEDAKKLEILDNLKEHLGHILKTLPLDIRQERSPK